MRYTPTAAASSSKMETGLLQPAWRRSHLSSRLLAAILALVVLQGTLTYAQIDVDPKQVTLTEGEKTSLLCRSGNKINYCRFIVPGAPQVLVLSETWPSKTPGYSYFGQGLAAGQCGVTIDRVIPQNHGQAKCFLGIEGDEIEGQIELTVALPPHRPELEVISKPPRNFFEADETLQARCISRDGRPAANISWFLNDEPILEGLGVPETAETTAADGTSKLFTSVQEIKRRLQPSDDGKFLVCRTSHIADRGQENMVKQQLLVKYLPLPQQEITVYGVTLTRTALINVTIQANPRPGVEWTVSGVVIPQGTQNGRYEAYEPAELGNGEYNVVLSIDSLTLEDTTKDYMLRASNELGQQEYIVRISSSNTPASSGLDIGAIIGIVVAVAVLLIIVVLIVFARATGRWCFGAHSSKSPTSETIESPVQQEASTALLSNAGTAVPDATTEVADSGPVLTTAYDSSNAATQPQSLPAGHAQPSPLTRGVYDSTTVPVNDQFIHYVPRGVGSGPPSTTGSSFLETDLDSELNSSIGGNNNHIVASSERKPVDLGLPIYKDPRWFRAQQKDILQKQAQLRTNRGSISTDIY